MKYLPRKIKALAHRTNKGASAPEIQALESTLQVKLPKALVSLYSDHNGVAERGKLAWRLLPIQEAKAANAELRRHKILPSNIRIFWTDDEGNSAGMYFDGPLTGNVCFFDHEERDFAPRFKTLERFLTALIAAAGVADSWREMPSDFPSPVNRADDGKLQQLRTQFHAATGMRKRRQLAFDIIALTPLERTADLLSFLDDKDLWVQERAAESLGERRYVPAIPFLVKVAQRNEGSNCNAQIGAIIGLGRMESAKGLESLLGLAGTIKDGLDIYIFRALELHGCPIKFDGEKWNFQLPGAKDWRTL